ncbi:MAG: Hsp70 family protein [Pirellulales bacterium]|nr:Hsp70 family protein [Pirellulales bacterium]
MTSRPRPVGIDLGTTNSAIAWVGRDGRTAMVPNSDGEILTPSVVCFQDAEVVVGKEARKATAVEPQRVAQWVKRDMGAPVYTRPIQGEYLPPEVIQACILRKLKADLAASLGDDCRVVITVPAYFDEPRRKATADAGEMAGIDVLDIVNEPTAAALAFGESIGYLAPGGAVRDELTVLIYDLGGGTFDVTLLRMAPGDIQALATDGDVRLGGHDWDMRLVDHVARAFRREHGLDPRDDPASMSRLMDSAVDAKHALSARSRTTLRVDHAGKSLDLPVTRAQFDEMTADLLERTIHTTRQVLSDIGMEWRHVDRLLLVGGSTRMPRVVERLRELSGLEPERSVNPDEAVARGAALFAQYLLTRGSTTPVDDTEAPTGFTVTNVTAHSLGVEGIDQATLRRTNVKLIRRNAPLPAKHTEKFVTKAENQRSIAIQILQGENAAPEECTPIGRTSIDNLPAGLPKGWPVEVTFEYEANGRLKVEAVVPGTHRAVTLELERSVGLSDDGLGQWKEIVASGAGFDAFEAMIAEALEEKIEPLPQSEIAAAPTKTESIASSPAAPIRSAPTPFRSAPTPLGASANLAAAIEEPSVPSEPEPARPVAKLDEPVENWMMPAEAPPASEKASTRRRSPRWIVGLVVYVTSGLAGAGLAYLLLSRLRPEQFPMPW